MYLSFRRSQDALLALGFFVLMVVVVFSTLLYFIERGTWDDTIGTFINSDGDPSQFASIPAAAWFVIVTISTVGFGEMTPRSFLGRLITLPLLLFGLLLIALPSFVLGREFSVIWNDMTSGQLQRTPYMQSELFTQSPRFLAGLRARQRVSEEHLHIVADSSTTSTTNSTSENDESYQQLIQSQTALETQLAEMRTAMDSQGTLLRRIMEKVDTKGS